MQAMGKLQDMVAAYIVKAGGHGGEKLALAADVSLSTVFKAMKGDHPPKPRNVYRLALACGCSEEEALALAKERSSLRPKRTA